MESNYNHKSNPLVNRHKKLTKNQYPQTLTFFPFFPMFHVYTPWKITGGNLQLSNSFTSREFSWFKGKLEKIFRKFQDNYFSNLLLTKISFMELCSADTFIKFIKFWSKLGYEIKREWN